MYVDDDIEWTILSRPQVPYDQSHLLKNRAHARDESLSRRQGHIRRCSLFQTKGRSQDTPYELRSLEHCGNASNEKMPKNAQAHRFPHALDVAAPKPSRTLLELGRPPMGRIKWVWTLYFHILVIEGDYFYVYMERRRRVGVKNNPPYKRLFNFAKEEKDPSRMAP